MRYAQSSERNSGYWKQQEYFYQGAITLHNGLSITFFSSGDLIRRFLSVPMFEDVWQTREKSNYQ
jgi:hypothetical protein